MSSMHEPWRRGTALSVLCALVLLAAPCAARGDEYADAMRHFRAGEFETALKKFMQAIDEQPGNERAYYYAAMCGEKLGKWGEAVKCWEAYQALASAASARKLAAVHVRMCKAKQAAAKPAQANAAKKEKIDYREFDKVELGFCTKRSERFIVRARNQALAQLASKKSEYYLDEIMYRFMRGRAWPRRTTITIYADHTEYVRKSGMPPWSGGGFMYEQISIDSVIRRVVLFQLDPKGKYRRNLLTEVLPHELTHLVLREYFGERRMPLALNEGLAMYMEEGTGEQSHSKMIKPAKQGKHMPFAKLYESTEYPKQWGKIGAFYAQSASATRFILSLLGRDGAATMLEEIKRGWPMKEALLTASTQSCGALTLASAEQKWRKYLESKAPKKPPAGKKR